VRLRIKSVDMLEGHAVQPTEEGVEELNGLSLERVERRCMPCSDKSAFVEWRYACAKA
jgi:hypothetical protein